MNIEQCHNNRRLDLASTSNQLNYVSVINYHLQIWEPAVNFPTRGDPFFTCHWYSISFFYFPFSYDNSPVADQQ